MCTCVGKGQQLCPRCVHAAMFGSQFAESQVAVDAPSQLLLWVLCEAKRVCDGAYAQSTICPVNKPHPRLDLIVSGSSRSLYAWRPAAQGVPPAPVVRVRCTPNEIYEQRIIICYADVKELKDNVQHSSALSGIGRGTMRFRFRRSKSD